MEFFNPIVMAAVGAGLAVGIPAVASAIGCGVAGTAGAGVLAEKEKEFGNAIILQALPQTGVIFGFVIALLIVLQIKDISTQTDAAVALLLGTKALGAGIAMGIAGLTPIYQGAVAAAGIGSTARNPKAKVGNIVMTALPDLSLLMGFVIAIMLLMM